MHIPNYFNKYGIDKFHEIDCALCQFIKTVYQLQIIFNICKRDNT
jgi:hypothetical protein